MPDEREDKINFMLLALVVVVIELLMSFCRGDWIWASVYAVFAILFSKAYFGSKTEVQ